MRGPNQSVVMLSAVVKMGLSRVLHRKQLSETAAEARQQPIGIIIDRTLGTFAFLDEVLDHLGDDVFRQSVQVELDGVPGPVATPIVVQVDLHGFVLLIDAVRKQVLNTGVLGERDMRSQIECETRVITDRPRKTTR